MQNFTELTLPIEGKLLYLEDSPVAVINSKLLKNTEGKVFALLELKCLSDKKIIAVKVSLDVFDIEGKQLEGLEEYSYLDLMMQKGNTFGKSHLIPLPDNNSRNFVPKIKLVVFDDMSKWVNECDLTVADSQKPLLDILLTSDNVNIYKALTTSASSFVPEETDKIWRCSCGGLNTAADDKCLNCLIEKETIFSLLDVEKLAEKKTELDKITAEKESAVAFEREINRKESKKDLIQYVITTVAALIIALIVSITGSIINNGKLYKEVKGYFDEGEDGKAVELLYEHKSLRKKCSGLICEAADVEYSEIKDIDRDFEAGYYSSYYLYTVELKSGKSLTVRRYTD